jgi:hypothetical protein
MQTLPQYLEENPDVIEEVNKIVEFFHTLSPVLRMDNIIYKLNNGDTLVISLPDFYIKFYKPSELPEDFWNSPDVSNEDFENLGEFPDNEE